MRCCAVLSEECRSQGRDLKSGGFSEFRAGELPCHLQLLVILSGNYHLSLPAASLPRVWAVRACGLPNNEPTGDDIRWLSHK